MYIYNHGVYMKDSNMKLLCLMCVSILTKGLSMETPYHPLEHNLTFPKDRKIATQTRIMGGQEVPRQAYPFQTALFINNGKQQIFCGGTLLTTTWVLTAAHCLYRYPRASSITVLLGKHNLTAYESCTQSLKVDKYFIHNQWSEETLQNDVALIKLLGRAVLNGHVNTVNISNSTDTYIGQSALALGWGTTESETRSTVLKGVTNTVISNQECSEIYGKIAKNHLCVSGRGITGSCYGDSGGPLLINNTQVGIVSFGAAFCNRSYPSVYTRLTEYHDWIIETMENGSKFRRGSKHYITIFVFFCVVANR